MSVHVVTTLHQDGYNLYGKKFIKTWEKFFPNDWQIDYYAESHTPEFSNRVRVLDFHNTCLNWQDYYQHIQELVQQVKHDKKQINRLKKALRWSFKMFTLLHCLETSKSDYVMWLDADVYARAKPDTMWIQNTLRNKCIAGQRENIKGLTHIETGVILIDRNHYATKKVVKWIEDGYIHKKILDEDKPWDGMWMGKLYNSNSVPFSTPTILAHEKHGNNSAHNTRYSWLVHQVGDYKFGTTCNGRSGRTEASELI